MLADNALVGKFQVQMEYLPVVSQKVLKNARLAQIHSTISSETEFMVKSILVNVSACAIRMT